MKDIEIFEECFKESTSGCRETCNCGKEYYNEDGGWDWEEGEIEELEKQKAITVDCSITMISFEGKEYCDVCNCWHERAEHLMGWILSHGYGIAKLLNKVKEREIIDANNLPEVKTVRTASSS